jgi:hypothetical protein
MAQKFKQFLSVIPVTGKLQLAAEERCGAR